MLTDKDGKKLQVGSIVAAQKPGRTNYTIRGRIECFHEETVHIFDFDRCFKRAYHWSKIKRIRYKGKPNETDVNF